ncbi:Protein pitchfork [Schistosoma japonicum]|nr:Protein pitchfork [Schistosoma japonicum]
MTCFLRNVGTYDVTKEPGRHVRWQMDTMLKPVNLPTIEQKSTIPINTDKLSTASESRQYQRKLAYLRLYF